MPLSARAITLTLPLPVAIDVPGAAAARPSQRRAPRATYLLMLLIAGAYRWGVAWPELNQEWFLHLQDGWANYFTYCFLHRISNGGFIQMALNLYALWLIGPPLEARVGGLRLVALFLASAGVGGMAWHQFDLGFEPLDGASVAILGLLGGCLVLFPRVTITWISAPLSREFSIIPTRLRVASFLLPPTAWVLLGIVPWLALHEWSQLGVWLDVRVFSTAAHLGGLLAGVGLTALMFGLRAYSYEVAARPAAEGPPVAPPPSAPGESSDGLPASLDDWLLPSEVSPAPPAASSSSPGLSDLPVFDPRVPSMVDRAEQVTELFGAPDDSDAGMPLPVSAPPPPSPPSAPPLEPSAETTGGAIVLGADSSSGRRKEADGPIPPAPRAPQQRGLQPALSHQVEIDWGSRESQRIGNEPPAAPIPAPPAPPPITRRSTPRDPATHVRLICPEARWPAENRGQFAIVLESPGEAKLEALVDIMAPTLKIPHADMYQALRRRHGVLAEHQPYWMAENLAREVAAQGEATAIVAQPPALDFGPPREALTLSAEGDGARWALEGAVFILPWKHVVCLGAARVGDPLSSSKGAVMDLLFLDPAVQVRIWERRFTYPPRLGSDPRMRFLRLAQALRHRCREALVTDGFQQWLGSEGPLPTDTFAALPEWEFHLRWHVLARLSPTRER